MSLGTYGDLKTSVASWINRTDLTTQIPDFVTLCESMVRKDVRIRDNETLVAGVLLVDEILAQPTDLVSTRRLTVGGIRLSYVTPEQYAQLKRNTVTGGKYTVMGSDFYILGAVIGDDYELLYANSFTALALDADTNWILETSPEVYLWGSLYNAAIYMKDITAAAGYKGLYDQSVALLNKQEKEATFSGPLTVRAETRE